MQKIKAERFGKRAQRERLEAEIAQRQKRLDQLDASAEVLKSKSEDELAKHLATMRLKTGLREIRWTLTGERNKAKAEECESSSYRVFMYIHRKWNESGRVPVAIGRRELSAHAARSTKQITRILEELDFEHDFIRRSPQAGDTTLFEVHIPETERYRGEVEYITRLLAERQQEGVK